MTFKPVPLAELLSKAKSRSGIKKHPSAVELKLWEKRQDLLVLCASQLSLLGRKSVISSDYQFPLPALGLGYQLVAPVHKNYICKQWEKARG